MNSNTNYYLGDIVTPTVGEWKDRISWVRNIQRDSDGTVYYAIRDELTKNYRWYAVNELSPVS